MHFQYIAMKETIINELISQEWSIWLPDNIGGLFFGNGTLGVPVGNCLLPSRLSSIFFDDLSHLLPQRLDIVPRKGIPS